MDQKYLKNIMLELAEKRPVFHSEADFQHELSMLLAKAGFAVRLEVPYEEENKKEEINEGDKKENGQTKRHSRNATDIIAYKDREKYAIELKYKTLGGEFNFEHGNFKEQFLLKDSKAFNANCYALWKDVERLENLINIDDYADDNADDDIKRGFVIFLTSSPAYFTESMYKKQRKCEAFIPFQDREFKVDEKAGELKMKETKDGTYSEIELKMNGANTPKKKNRYSKIKLKKSYKTCWEDFSECKTVEGKEAKFKYLLLEI